MLLDRRRVRFWQKWIFGFMAFLMAAFLIVGYSGVLSSCHLANGVTGGNPLDQAIKTATAAYNASPKDPTAILALAQAYQARAVAEVSGSTGQASDSRQALAYYTKYLAMSDKKLGAKVRSLRLDALQQEIVLYTLLNQSGELVGVYNKLISLDPRNPDYYLRLGAAASDAGDTATALLAFSRFLQLAPHSQYAQEVKQRIATLTSQLKTPSSAPSVKPSPSATK